MMARRDQHTRRFLELIDQLADEVGRTHGWKKQVAERLGVSQSYIPQLTKDASRSVRKESMLRAAKRLGIKVAFFEAKKGEHYRDFTLQADWVFNKSKPLADALDLAEDLAMRNVGPNTEQSRQMAFDIVQWADRELETIARVRDLAKRVLMSSDKEAAVLGGGLAHTIFMWKGTGPAGSIDWTGVGDAEIGKDN